MSTTLLKITEVEKRVGKKKSSIYAAIQAGMFPAPVSLGPRSSAWVEAEIEQWVQERIQARQSVMKGQA
ncbi:helix-turn-helix transcriptional regulator [Noviherbaspirillum pedocola]|uniref:AlpA family transcriptional regulator n=1 Tax=Noviherbaspirillum pedocola TaxID=2801341 RepID=A0A934SZX2_9BURK|nr:AlpA family transcriptional regulator [Noviherbaspirillum pedocola]MBK4735839.1 AlpA family transcriptional regulator [Noviherbaspirillum pedocola]